VACPSFVRDYSSGGNRVAMKGTTHAPGTIYCRGIIPSIKIGVLKMPAASAVSLIVLIFNIVTHIQNSLSFSASKYPTM
jgi:hypothetical protein